MKIRAQIVSFILTLFIVTQPLLPYLEYALFRDYISTNLCVEKDIVDSCCKGQCHLAMRLAEAAPTPEKSPASSKEIKLQKTMEFELPNNFACNKPQIISHIVKITHLQFYKSVFLKICFRPPQFL